MIARLWITLKTCSNGETISLSKDVPAFTTYVGMKLSDHAWAPEEKIIIRVLDGFAPPDKGHTLQLVYLEDHLCNDPEHLADAVQHYTNNGWRQRNA